MTHPRSPEHEPEPDRGREVFPPGPNDPGLPNRIVSVILQPGERVRWEWSIAPDGRRYVSGYRIIPAWRRPKKGPPGPPHPPGREPG